jgi:hypothetical protein
MKTSIKTSILEDSFYGGVHRGVPIAGYEEFVLPVIQKVLASSRHLSATSLARFANRVRSGHDHRGCSKTHCAAAIAAVYCTGSREGGFIATANDEYINKFCRDLRFASNGYSRQSRTTGEPAPVESDRDYIVARLAEVNAELSEPVRDTSTATYLGVNRFSHLKSERYELTRALAALGEGVGNFTLKLDSKQKFFAVLDALTQYVENCKDEDHLTDDVRGKVAAAEEICDQLEAVLASLTKG